MRDADESFYDNILVRDADERYSAREKLAIELGERFALDHESIDEEFVDRLRAEYSDAEVLDLMMCAARFLGFGRMTQVLRLT